MDWLSDNERFKSVDRETVSLIRTVTGADIRVSEEVETVDMWEAWENGLNQAHIEGMSQEDKQGYERGKARGLESARTQNALTMFADHLPVDKVAKYSNLSIQEATNLGRQHGYL